jgi:hypothetical protein
MLEEKSTLEIYRYFFFGSGNERNTDYQMTSYISFLYVEHEANGKYFLKEKNECIYNE